MDQHHCWQSIKDNCLYHRLCYPHTPHAYQGHTRMPCVPLVCSPCATACYPLLPRTKLNVVVQVKPWLYLKTLIDCWYIYSQKRVTFPLSLIESVNQSSKFWIKICGFHAQVFDWFSRVFHCLFTGFSRSFHALFTLWVWSGICLKLWSPVYIYTSTHWVW